MQPGESTQSQPNADTHNPAAHARVLIVDDSADAGEVLAMRLERDGYTVARATDGTQALAAVAQQRFDLILLDVRMPGLSGFDVLAHIRRTRGLLDLPVIMLSGRDDTADVVRALAIGANDYLVKPLDFRLVRARIQTQLVGHRLKELNDKLLGIASHDLKKPLLVMQDIVHSLRHEHPPGSTVDAGMHESLAFLADSVAYMRRLVEASLDLRAIEVGQLKLNRSAIAATALVRAAHARNRNYAEQKRIALEVDLAADAELAVDEMRIAQVLDNLIGNAIKFSPAGASVRVRTRREANDIAIEISDTGPGVAHIDPSELFTEYAARANSPTGTEDSTGLGLAFCKELVELHGGRIGAGNNAGGGATFWIRLPLAGV